MLWKLGRKAEALKKVEELLKRHPRDPVLLEMAVAFHLDQDRAGRARELFDRWVALAAPGEAVEELRMWLLLQEGRAAEALPRIERFLEREPDNPALLSAHGDALAALHRRREALAAYRRVNRLRPGNPKLLWRIRNLTERAAPGMGLTHWYFHGPDVERYHRITQSGRFWPAPRWRMEAGLREGFYKKGPVEGADPIDRLVVTHFLDNRFFGENGWFGDGAWEGAYVDGTDFQELRLGAGRERPRWESRLEAALNHLVRDPVEGLEKRATLDRFSWKHRWRPNDRWELNGGLVHERYRVDGSRNSVNGSQRLGNRWSGEGEVSWTVWEEPAVSLFLRARDTHWNKSFPEADRVVGFLADERVYSGGLFARWRPTRALELSGSVTRGTDSKRRVNFTYWVGEAGFWLGERARWSFLAEYDRGDSGAAGKGNSQILLSTLTVYWE